MSAPARLILVHKQDTSARTRFLRYANGIVAPEPFPPLTAVLDENDAPRENGVVMHPAALVKRVTADIGLQADEVVLESDFHASVDTPEGVAPVYLGRITTVDPPFDVAEKAGARFIAITEARDLSPSDLELMRRAYACVME